MKGAAWACFTGASHRHCVCVRGSREAKATPCHPCLASVCTANPEAGTGAWAGEAAMHWAASAGAAANHAQEPTGFHPQHRGAGGTELCSQSVPGGGWAGAGFEGLQGSGPDCAL